MVHAVKIYPEYYEAVKSGKKPFEVRKNDRDYKVGDILALNEFEPGGAGTGEYSGRAIIARISYVLANSEFCKPGYVVLGLLPCEIFDTETGIEAGILRQFGLSVKNFTEVNNND